MSARKAQQWKSDDERDSALQNCPLIGMYVDIQVHVKCFICFLINCIMIERMDQIKLNGKLDMTQFFIIIIIFHLFTNQPQFPLPPLFPFPHLTSHLTFPSPHLHSESARHLMGVKKASHITLRQDQAPPSVSAHVRHTHMGSRFQKASSCAGNKP